MGKQAVYEFKIEKQVPKEVRLVDLHNYCLEKNIQAEINGGVPFIELISIKAEVNANGRRNN